MRTRLMPVILLLAVGLRAKEPRFYDRGTLAEVNAVRCDYEEKDGKGVTSDHPAHSGQTAVMRRVLPPEPGSLP